jgi:hypothetical protein
VGIYFFTLTQENDDIAKIGLYAVEKKLYNGTTNRKSEERQLAYV